MNVRVRIAPSPTGFAHVGTAYMALFNWAFAKKNQGVFILRLEDTDQKRHVPEAEEAIYSALKWLNINPDESPVVGGSFGPYRQSERLKRYQDAAKELVKSGTAYEKDGAVWLIMPKDITLGWEDAVRGQIDFDSNQLKDWVILKSDSNPTYNFANVIDDLDMQITHVIRGEEHISNTPLQLSVYQALEKEPPIFAHLPVLRAVDHKKLSKRRDPVSLQWFREEGYLPEALLNFLALQGWSHPDEKDIFPASEFAELISLERIKTSAPVFDFKKLDWLNGQYIKSKSNQELTDLISKDFAKEIPKELVEKYNGKVPSDEEKLIVLPGVGRKTIGVFLSEIGKDAIGVDTHVSYISQKLGWTNNSQPEKIEKDLMNLFPKKHWKEINSSLVRFGKTHTSRMQKDEILEEIKKIK